MPFICQRRVPLMCFVPCIFFTTLQLCTVALKLLQAHLYFILWDNTSALPLLKCATMSEGCLYLCMVLKSFQVLQWYE